MHCGKTWRAVDANAALVGHRTDLPLILRWRRHGAAIAAMSPAIDIGVLSAGFIGLTP
jgi:hypothetical protein